MSQEVYFKPVSGIGTAVSAQTKEEQRILDEQLKRREQQQRAEFIRKQYEEDRITRQEQEMRGDRLNFVESLAATLGVAGVITSASQQAEIKRVVEQSKTFNEIETPFVNLWAARTSSLPNNPFRDKALLSSMIGPNGEQLFSNAGEAQEHFRMKAMFAALYQHYGVNEETKVAAETHVDKAREGVQTILADGRTILQSGLKVNEPINPSAEVETQQGFDRAVQLMDLRITLQQEIERTAIAAGMEDTKAKTLAAEVTAAFLHEQASRDQILLDMKAQQAEVQAQIQIENGMKVAETKEQAIQAAAIERAAAGVEQNPPTVNLDAKTREQIEQQRALAEQLNHGGPGDPPKPGDPEFNNDPNKTDPTAVEQTFEPVDVPVANFQPAVYDEYGNAALSHTAIDVGGAATSDAAKRTDSRDPKSGPRAGADLSVRETREGIQATGPAALQRSGREPRGLVGPGDPEWNPHTNN